MDWLYNVFGEKYVDFNLTTVKAVHAITSI